MRFDMIHPADQLVLMMQRIYDGGMTTTSGGNLSVLDDEGNIWITPSGIDKGSLTRRDIICRRPDGELIGIHKPSVELPFHHLLYQTRPDIRAVLHAHPPGLVAFSNIRRIPDTTLIPNMHKVSGKLAMAAYEIPGSDALGVNIAKVFEQGANTAILENHGVVVGAKDLFSAFVSFETLEYCARLQINATRLGTPRGLTEKQISISENKQDIKMDEFEPKDYSPAECAARRDICELILRAYRQKLFTSSQGTFSQRVDGNNFVITPYAKDRGYLQPEDLVMIRDGKKEAGKNPSRSVPLHQAIYEKHPEVNSVIIAHPSNIMAFAVTEVPFESTTIPESYINLRNVKKLPFGCSFMQPVLTADELSPSSPVALVENDCVIVTGADLLNAYDRLEVAEYSAKSIIASRELGKIVKISSDELRDIEKAFHLQ